MQPRKPVRPATKQKMLSVKKEIQKETKVNKQLNFFCEKPSY